MLPTLVACARRRWSVALGGSVSGMLAPALVGAVLALASEGPAHAQGYGQADWEPCASEGRTCRFAGEGLVRYGADGRYAYRVVNGRVRCDDASFGDAAPGLRKRCDVSYNWRDDPRLRHLGAAGAQGGGGAWPSNDGVWQLCAPEGGDCRVHGQAVVRFGVSGRWELRTVVNQVACSTRAFGDPAPGAAKRCEVQVQPPGPAPLPVPVPGRMPVQPGQMPGQMPGQGPAPAAAGGEVWVPCAQEDEICQVPGPTRVRFGGHGMWMERPVQQPVRCEVQEFGDPAPDQRKRCEYLRIGRPVPPLPGAGGVGAAAVGPDPLRPGDWTFCAAEGGRCQLRGVSMVRFGVPGRYRYREAGQTLPCEAAQFGGDPAPGQRKQCDVLNPVR